MSKVDSVIAYGMQEIGKPYVFGDEGPDSFDCSGLIQYIFAKVGIKLPRTAREQQRFVAPVTNPRAGDLVFWGAPAYHMGLYLGGDRVLHAPRSGDRVRVAKIWGSPTYGRPAGLGIGSGVVGTPVGVGTQQVAFGLGELTQGLADFGRLMLFAAGGVALVALGAWQLSKGGSTS